MTTVLRKVSEILDTFDFPFSVIETQNDGVIIEIPPTKVVKSTVIEEQLNEEGEIVEVEVEVSSIVEIDTSQIGDPASWEDVNNPLYFDFKIGDNVYSWMPKDGFRKVGITETGDVGLVTYKVIRINNDISSTRHIITPRFTPLRLENGRFTINGICRPEQKFIDATTGQMRTMHDIMLLRGNIEKHLTYDVLEEECDPIL